MSLRKVDFMSELVMHFCNDLYRPQRPQAYLFGVSMAGFSSVMSDREIAVWSIREGKKGPSPEEKGQPV